MHPEKVLFVDEVGCNTSQKSDGNIGGEKFLVDPDSQARIRSAFKDYHFTVLGFTDAEGMPVLCAIVLVCKVLKYEYVMGVTPFAETEENASLSDENCDGEEKWFPFRLKKPTSFLWCAWHGGNPLQ